MTLALFETNESQVLTDSKSYPQTSKTSLCLLGIKKVCCFFSLSKQILPALDKLTLCTPLSIKKQGRVFLSHYMAWLISPAKVWVSGVAPCQVQQATCHSHSTEAGSTKQGLQTLLSQAPGSHAPTCLS